MMIEVLMAVGLAVQQPAAQQPAPARQQPTSDVSVEGTISAVSDIAVKVANLKSELDQMRRAVYNSPGGVVLVRANELRGACDSLVSVIERREQHICRDCMTARHQAPVSAYRAYLPQLSRAGRQCSAQITQLRQGTTSNADSAAARTRRVFEPVSSGLIDALRGYEQRLEPVRRVLGPSQGVTPGRPSR